MQEWVLWKVPMCSKSWTTDRELFHAGFYSVEMTINIPLQFANKSTSASKDAKERWFRRKICLLVILAYTPLIINVRTVHCLGLTGEAGHHRWLSTIWSRLLLHKRGMLELFVILVIFMAYSYSNCGVGMSDTSGTLIIANGNVKLCLSRMWRELTRSKSSRKLDTVFWAVSD